MTASTLGRGELRELFAQFRTSAFRLETRTYYQDADVNNSPFRRWRAGYTPDDTWAQSWVETVRAATANGRCIYRVRVLNNPPSDYQLFARDLALRCNIPAGENILVLSEDQAAQLHLPQRDFWLFDDQHLVVLHFDENGAFEQARSLTDTTELDQYHRWAQRAWDHAVPYAQHGSTRE